MAPVEVPPDLVGQSSLYTHADPLIKRLRLQDSTGKDIGDVERYFKNKDVLVLYAGSEGGSNNLRRLHSDLTQFAVRYLKSASVMYVSTDTSPLAPERVLSGQAWMRMVFQDNSDFASVGDNSTDGLDAGAGRRYPGVEDVKRGEEFITAGELEVGAESVTFGLDENPYDYARPLSRAAVTSIMKAYSTPSISIYHIPTHTFLARNVKPATFTSDNIDKAYHTWRNGGTPKLRVVDVLRSMKWYIVMLVLAVGYRVLVIFGGKQYDVLPGLVEQLTFKPKQ